MIVEETIATDITNNNSSSISGTVRNAVIIELIAMAKMNNESEEVDPGTGAEIGPRNGISRDPGPIDQNLGAGIGLDQVRMIVANVTRVMINVRGVWKR